MSQRQPERNWVAQMREEAQARERQESEWVDRVPERGVWTDTMREEWHRDKRMARTIKLIKTVAWALAVFAAAVLGHNLPIIGT